MPEYNLLEEPWIEAIDSAGKPLEVSIRRALLESHSIKRLTSAIPLVNASVLWLLETVLIRSMSNAGIALDDYEKWLKGYYAGAFDAGVLEKYFQTWHDRFYLFDDEHPFLQVNIKEEDFSGSAMKLLPHFSGGTGGNSATLFDQHTEAEGIALSKKEAANYLLAAHQYGSGGRIIGGDYFTESLPCNGLSIFLEGENLFESLYLNLLPYPDIPECPTKMGDCPLWERDDPQSEAGRVQVQEEKNTCYRPMGLLDLLTWPGRKIQLLCAEDGMVHEIKMRNGIRMAELAFPWYAYNGKGFELRARQDHAVWRDYAVLLQFPGLVAKGQDKSNPPLAVRWLHELKRANFSFDHMLSLAAFGMAKEAGKQKVYFYTEQRLPLPQEYLGKPELVLGVAAQIAFAESVQDGLYGSMMIFAEGLLSFDAEKKNGRKPDGKDKQNLVAHLGAERNYWGMLEQPFFDLLVALPSQSESAIEKWKNIVKDAARMAFDQAVALAGESISVWKAEASARRMLNAVLKKILER